MKLYYSNSDGIHKMNRFRWRRTVLGLLILILCSTFLTHRIFNSRSSLVCERISDPTSEKRSFDIKYTADMDDQYRFSKSSVVHIPRTVSTMEEMSQPFQFTREKASSVCKQVLNRYGVQASIGVEEECQHYVMEFPSAWMELFEKINKYVTWHNQTSHMVRKRLEDGDSMTNVLGDLRTLTYRCKKWPRCAGYGDQAQKTARGFLLAMLAKRFFTVEWSPNFVGSDKWLEVLTPTVLNWKMDPPFSSELLQPNMSENCTISGSTTVVKYAHSTHYRRQHVYYYVLNITDIFCKDVSQIDMEPQHIAYFCKEAKRDHYIEQPNRIFFIYGLIHRLMYQFSDGVIERGEKRLRELGLLHNPFVAVHIRTALEETSVGKLPYYLKVDRYQRDQASWRLFINCGESAASKYNIHRPLLLFSDSSDCLKWASQMYPLSRITYSNSSFWHFTEHAELEESEEIVDKILDTMSDLYLVSKATVVVKGISLFTNLGMYLGSISNNNAVRCDLKSESILQKRMHVRHRR